jgi:SAM-dependent methyltransferase
MKKAIDVGCGKGGFLREFVHDYLPDWEGEELKITRMDGDKSLKPDVVHDLMKPMPKELIGLYDFVYMSHVLEHMAWRDAPSVANEVGKLVKPGGYFLILVPSLEWVARELVRGKFNIGVMMCLYGGQDDEWQFHKSGYTKPALNILAKQIGLTALSIKDGPIITVHGESMTNAFQLELFMQKPEVSE